MSDNMVPIVVAIDFDDTAPYALREACQMALGRADVVLHLVHVLPPVGDGKDDAEKLAAVPARLRGWVRERCLADRSLGNPRVSVHVRTGEAPAALVQLCVDVQARVLVLGSNQRHGIDRLAHGSVAEQVVRAARCPVLVARPVDYTGLTPTEQPDPPCPACAKVRADTRGAQLWCEQHAQPHLRMHVYDAVDEISVVPDRTLLI